MTQRSDWEMGDTVRNARSGDRTALLRLIDHCRGAIASAIAGVKPPPGVDLEEAAHLARLKIFENFTDGYSGTGAPCGWMAVVARNRTRDLVRSELRHTSRNISIDLLSREDPHLSTASNSGQVDTWDTLHRVLSRLPDDDAELLTLHYLQGFSRTELADRLGYSYDGIRSKLTRACGRAHQIMTDMQVPRD